MIGGKASSRYQARDLANDWIGAFRPDKGDCSKVCFASLPEGKSD